MFTPRRTSCADEDEEARTLLYSDPELPSRSNPPFRAACIRALALLCVCCLSIGSHYASFILGPLKSRLSREIGTSNTEFSLLLAALASSGTWTPLVGGLMVSKLGTVTSSIIATGAVFFGQLLLLIGQASEDVRLMTLGMFIFGLGVNPLQVVQETIIVRFFKSHGLGVSLALGLVAGKGASFLSARTSYPLSQISPSAPFYAATAATGLSFVVNILYMSISKWLVRESDSEYEAADLNSEARRHSTNLTEAIALQKVAEKRRVKVKEIFKLGDVFWAYIGLNFLCGVMWSTFSPLAPNILERRFSLSELEASDKASFLFGGSVFLYPLCGFLVDKAKKRPIIIQLLTCASILSLLCYSWLSLPASLTKTPWPAIISFGTAMGFAPLLLVVIVPRLVPLQYVSTALGMHKSLEHVGSTIMQTLIGLWLDLKTEGDDKSSRATEDSLLQWLLNGFVFLNVLQLLAIWALAYLDRKKKNALASVQNARRQAVENTHRRPSNDDDDSINEQDETLPLLEEATSPHQFPLPIELDSIHSQSSTEPPEVKPDEIRRGKLFAVMSLFFLVFSWVLFLGTSFVKIRSRKDRPGGSSFEL